MGARSSEPDSNRTRKTVTEKCCLLQDIFKDAIESNLASATEVPYFEGDFWPNVIEESIKELDQEEEEKRKREEAEAAAEAEAALETTEEIGIEAVCIFFVSLRGMQFCCSESALCVVMQKHTGSWY